MMDLTKECFSFPFWLLLPCMKLRQDSEVTIPFLDDEKDIKIKERESEWGKEDDSELKKVLQYSAKYALW